MKRIKVFSILLITAFITSCATPIESARVSMANNYKQTFHKYLGSSIGSLEEYIPVNEMPSDWTKMFSIQFMIDTKMSPRALMTGLTNRTKKQCGKNSSFNLISEEANSITFEWSVKNCKRVDNMKTFLRGHSKEDCNMNYFTGIMWRGSEFMKPSGKCTNHATQSEIVKLIKGNDGIHRIAFTQKTKKITGDFRKHWLASLKKAYVTKGGARITIK